MADRITECPTCEGSSAMMGYFKGSATTHIIECSRCGGKGYLSEAEEFERLREARRKANHALPRPCPEA